MYAILAFLFAYASLHLKRCFPSPSSSQNRVSTCKKSLGNPKLFFSPNETVDRLRPTPTSVGQGGTQGPPIALTMAPDGLRSFASPSASRLFSLELGESRIFLGVSMFGSRRYLYKRIYGKVTSLEGKSTPFSVPKTRGEAGGTRRQSGASDAMEERICDEGRGRVDAAAADGVPGLDDSPWRPRAAAPVDDPPPQRLFLNMHTKQDQVEVGSKN